MREEFKTICELLGEWCKKNGKDFATISFVDGNTQGNVRPDDTDYRELNIFIKHGNHQKGD